MKKLLVRFLSVLLVLVMGACGACSAFQLPNKQPTESQAIDRALQSTIVLYRKNDLICAGARISPTHVLTAYHCVVAAILPINELILLSTQKDFAQIPVRRVQLQNVDLSTYQQYLERNRNGVEFKTGKIERVDPIHDLAMIYLKDPYQAFVEARSGYLSVGEPLFSIGHPMGQTFTFARGYASVSCRKDSELLRGCWTQADITIYGGSSGGGLYDDSGQLVGVASAGVDMGGIGYFTTPEVTYNFIHNLKQSE